MCGLAGFLDGAAHDDAAAMLACAQGMARQLAHRGPDSAGAWVDERAGYGVGHQRLAILDLTPAGAQPMLSRDSRYVLAFNGEIYDFRRLRARLEGQGVRLRGTSDTEVLLECIVRDGLVPTLREVDGMFALALWDRRERALVLARDKAGEKPLYYGRAGRAFVFGSELNALRAHPDARFELDRDALSMLMRLSYIPAPWSVFRQVRKLAAGTLLVVDGHGQHGEPSPYWSVREVAEAGLARPWDGTADEAVDELERLLRVAVRNRLESDVPLGAFLSGGIDSSTIAALASQESTSGLRTFAVSVGAGNADEGPAAQAVARHLGTVHTELRVEARDGLDLVPTLPAMYDEPFADPSQIPTALICAAARSHVTVCLSGDAGDEVFGGYNRYTAGEAVWRRSARVPLRARTTAGALVMRIPPAGWDALYARAARAIPSLRGRDAVGTKVHKAARLVMAQSEHDAYQSLVSQWQDPDELVLGGQEHPTAAAAGGWLPGAGLAGDMMYLDALSTLPDEMLTKVDRASMAVGLEVRVPLVAPDVVAFAWSLPPSLKIRSGQGKWPLRQLLARHVPQELWDRPKLGFDPPLGEWLRGPLRPWAEDLIGPSFLRNQGLFEPGRVASMWREHQDGRGNHDYALWALLVAQQWLVAQAQPVVAA